jgi:hypothetical protein
MPILQAHSFVLQFMRVELLGADDGLGCVVDEDVQLVYCLPDVGDERGDLRLGQEIALDYK